MISNIGRVKKSQGPRKSASLTFSPKALKSLRRLTSADLRRTAVPPARLDELNRQKAVAKSPSPGIRCVGSQVPTCGGPPCLRPGWSLPSAKRLSPHEKHIVTRKPLDSAASLLSGLAAPDPRSRPRTKNSAGGPGRPLPRVSIVAKRFSRSRKPKTHDPRQSFTNQTVPANAGSVWFSLLVMFPLQFAVGGGCRRRFEQKGCADTRRGETLFP